LIIRKWEKGDYFQPLGMKNMKKVSDFFIDNKLSISQKELTWILTSGKNIVWIIGLRIDERYKITSETKRALRVKLK
jgi:tRNA(Ile)-lysidine synthase